MKSIYLRHIQPNYVCACMNVNIQNMDQSTYHCKKETYQHKEVVVPCECNSDPKKKLAQAGSHQNGAPANSGKRKSKNIHIVNVFSYLHKYVCSHRQIAI